MNDKKIKVYLDDVRPAPEGWTLVRWPDEAIELLMGGEVSHVSLDHDLGDDERGTGYQVLTWIEEIVAVGDHDFLLPEITLHTANSPARARMQSALDKIQVIYDMRKNAKEGVAAAVERASTENRRALQIQRMQPALAECLDDLLDELLQEYGERVDRIVVIGSAVAQGFRAGSSDVDIVFLTNDNKGRDRSYSDILDFEERINKKFQGPWAKIDVTEKSLKHVIKVGTNYQQCYEGHVLRGFAVYSKNPGDNTEGYEILSKDDARKYVVEQYLYQAWRWLGGTSGMTDSASYTTCRAVCRSLHAVLASHDMGFAPKHFRWNITELCNVAETLSPGLHVKHLVDLLPADLAFIDFDKAGDIDDGLTEPERRRKIAIGIIVTRKIERHLGVRADPHSRLVLRGLRRYELDWARKVKAEGATDKESL